VLQKIFRHTFANGFTLLAEHLGHVRSAAFNFLVPAGCAYDPPRHRGIASVLAELITRGAGEMGNHALALALDNLGLDRDESAGVMHLRFWGATLAQNLARGLEIYADILRRPHLPADELDAVKALALQDLQGLEDEPRQKVLVEVLRQHFPSPLGQDRHGTVEGIESLTAEAVRRHWVRHFQPNGTILSIAGNIEWEPLRDLVGRLFADWKAATPAPLKVGKPPKYRPHLVKKTAQTQIGIAYPSVPVQHPDYYAALGAVNVLSGGSSSRLFTEVREKRGLCYAVWATYRMVQDRACVLCYAGTTTDRAQETLDVTLAEIKRLQKGVEREEVKRVQAGLKSALVMQEESTSARASSLASDWYNLGRIRSFEEILAGVNSLSPERVVAHLRKHPPRKFTIVTLGPKPLRTARSS
jgi:predicted Zn-dependent peptidase